MDSDKWGKWMRGTYYRTKDVRITPDQHRLDFLLCEGLEYFNWNRSIGLLKVNATIGDHLRVVYEQDDLD